MGYQAIAAFAGSVLLVSGASGTIVPYTGSFDESTGTSSGDYSELGGTVDVGQFELLAGTNTFFGGIVTPGDPSDAFNIILNEFQTLVDVRIEFDLGADLFNPIAINQNSLLRLFDIDTTDPLPVLSISLSSTGNFAANPVFSETGPNEFGVLVSSEVLALNSGGPVRYRIEFDVIDVPAPGALMAFGVFSVGLRRRRVG